MHSGSKAVLVVQQELDQGRLWSLSFESQGFNVIQDCPRESLLDDVNLKSLTLLVLDMTSKALNPYDVCREIRGRHAHLPIILTYQTQRHLAPVERRWALAQGATEIIPALVDGVTALQKLQLVFEKLGWQEQLNVESLQENLMSHGYLEGSPDLKETSQEYAKSASTPAQNSSPHSTEVSTSPARPKRILMYRGQPMEV